MRQRNSNVKIDENKSGVKDGNKNQSLTDAICKRNPQGQNVRG